MVREVCVHDDHKVAGAEFEPMHVRGAEPEFARARLQVDALGGVDFLELARDDLCTVGGGVVDDYELPVEIATGGG